MDERAAKLALARKKLKDHQDKKSHVILPKNDVDNILQENDLTTVESEEVSTALLPIRQIDEFSKHSSELKQDEYVVTHKNDVNATEILISGKIKLEQEISYLKSKNAEQEVKFLESSNKCEYLSQKLITLENQLQNININYNTVVEKLALNDNIIEVLHDEKNNLHEELEFTKTILAAKETENDSLHSQLFNIQSILDTTQLQLQQLTSGAHDPNNKHTQESLRHENEMLTQKVSSLEQQLKSQLKDSQQINSQFEHYVGELNEQLKMVTKKNEDLLRDIQNLSNRENDLIEQLSEMEIRLQNCNRAANENGTIIKTEHSCNLDEHKDLITNYKECQEILKKTDEKYMGLQKLYNEALAKIEEQTQSKELEMRQNNNVSLAKLHADMTSDKLAAQRATEQNKKLKTDLLGLEETVAKMTKDKLDLTEKITAEKFLNRELTIKLAEIDEKSNILQTTLKAKDEEMIRLQATVRDLEKSYEEVKQTSSETFAPKEEQELSVSKCEGEEHHHCTNEKIDAEVAIQCPNRNEYIPKGEAMHKLQEIFLKIMEEVADLSDEKHRLEHIIMQLQNETDTICEYVALYQQQRSLLKKRDEERSAQVKSFQTECTRLQKQLDELTGILKRFSEDNELSSYFQVPTKHEDIKKVMTILSSLKSSSVLDPKKTLEFDNFYPCSCCSGKLIDV